MSSSDWFELRVRATVAELENVAARLVEEVPYATQGVELRGAEVVFWVPAAERERALAMTQAAADRLAGEGWPVDPSRVSAVPAAPESEWRDAWKKYFHATRLTRQLVVVPSWEAKSYRPEPHDLLLHLDPGQAFGTGAHASTQVVLAELQARADAGETVSRVLDVGTGSGILLLGAAALWPALTALASDIDPLAVAATRENLAANGVAARAEVVEASVPDTGGERFELVLANIQAHVLRDIAAELAATVAPGGHLVLSGVLSFQVEGVVEVYAGHGFALEKVRAAELDPEWSGIVLRGP